MTILALSEPKVRPWSSIVEGDEHWIGPTVEQLWNYAMHVLHNIFRYNKNTTDFSLGR